MDKAAYLHIKDELHNDIKMEIENYCKMRGKWWDSLLESVGRVEIKIASEALKREANEKKRQERRVRHSRGGKADREDDKGKQASGEETVEKPVEPFVRKDEDFPPLV
jgi:hypothetical protein